MVIKQYLTNLIINGIIMSFAVPPQLRHFFLFLYSRGGIKGSVQGHCVILSPKLKLGKGSYINRCCIIDNGQAFVEIGNNCAIACGVKLLTTNHDYSNPQKRAGLVSGKRIIIEDGCWIGAGVTILPGTEIGEGTIIAAGSVVKGRLNKNSIYAGNPAQIVRSLE